jgi:hypothetical protein
VQFDEKILKLGAGLSSNSAGVSERDLRAKILTLQNELGDREREAGACTCNKKRKSTASSSFSAPAASTGSALHAPTHHMMTLGRKGEDMSSDSAGIDLDEFGSAYASGTGSNSNKVARTVHVYAPSASAATNSLTFSAGAGTSAVNFSSKAATASTSAAAKRRNSSSASAASVPALPPTLATAMVKSASDRNLREWS